MSLTTAFALIQQAVIDALLQAPALADGHVTPALDEPMPAEWPAHIAVRLDSADVTSRLLGAPRQVTSQVYLDITARGAPGVNPREALDALLSDVDTRVQALNLGAYGVTEQATAVRLQWNLDLASTQLQSITYSFDIQHDVRAGLRVS